MSWEARFRHLHFSLPQPVPLPSGNQLNTLSEARAFIFELPAEEAAAVEWQNAIRELLLAAEHGGIHLDFARMAMMRALNRGKQKPGVGKLVRERPWMKAKRVQRT